jgi:hypothetical protein
MLRVLEALELADELTKDDELVVIELELLDSDVLVEIVFDVSPEVALELLVEETEVLTVLVVTVI